MIVGLAVVLACQLMGEILARFSHLPLPAPVIGMVLLFLIFLVRERFTWLPFEVRGEPLDVSCDTLLQHMALLFVPAGVGVVQELHLITTYGVGLAMTVLITTVVSISVTALTFNLVARRLAPPDDHHGEHHP